AGTAAGVALSADSILDAVAQLQEAADRLVLVPPGEPWPELGCSISDPSSVRLSLAFANLVMWTRTMQERLSHPWRKKDVGLVPAMAPRLRHRVAPVVADFNAVVERTLANYMLHGGLALPPFEGVKLLPGNKVFVQVPDRTEETIPTRWHLTFDQ